MIRKYFFLIMTAAFFLAACYTSGPAWLFGFFAAACLCLKYVEV